MTRRLRLVGTSSGNDGCPTLYEVENTDSYLVQGDVVTDPAELRQLRNLKDGEGAVIVPRELLANFGPKEPVHVPHEITFEEFGAMFRTLAHSAWRLETRRRYAEDEETDTWREFMSNGTVRWDLDDPWCRGHREQSALGKRFERVRLVDDPPTPGQRYLLDNARRNTAVGEDIRILSRAAADELELPAEGFWIFDARVVALLRFDGDDALTGVELITDPVQVVRYCRTREAAWHHAVPYDQAQV
ncbi:DUF6879 family protein [Streptomyces avicenniae]|uniref:DUF6879 family protein n=1 Tax=Streptomyces avicenniae TaxID=500153 RepID=UPI00069A4BAB|nr:DUF6879 family protein [Streptomyces avicenniae]